MTIIQRIGILGGSFNPIHIGHLLIAERAREQMKLDKVLFIPTGNPPHREPPEVSCEDRINMVAGAIEDNPYFELCRIEADSAEVSYTADTLIKLKDAYPGGTLYFIVGSDALVQMDSWKSPEKIFSLCEVITTVRSGKNTDELDYSIDNFKKLYNAKIHSLKMPFIDISSTAIRERIKNGESVRYMVPHGVLRSIDGHDLYK